MLPLWVLAVGFGLVSLLVAIEWAWGRTRGIRAVTLRESLANAGCGLLFGVAHLAFLGATVALYAAASRFAPVHFEPSPILYVGTFLGLEFVYYVQHRLEHRVPLLWAIHAVHHQSRECNLTVSLRIGVLASVTTAIFQLPLALLGVPATVYATVVAVQGVFLFGLHARFIDNPLGPGRVLNAPSFHRLHHSSERAHIDTNFGGVLTIFDHLFRTFTPFRGEEPTYGTVSQRRPESPIEANVAPLRALFHRAGTRDRFRDRLAVLFFERP